jgi:hypothetical protein
MKGHGEKLSRNQERAIAAFLQHPTIPDAAKAVGVGESTLYRWLQNSAFQAKYADARREVTRHAIAQVQAGMSEAVRTLQHVMNDKKAPASARVSAARTMLDIGIKAVEIEDLEKRVGEIEKLMEDQRT